MSFDAFNEIPQVEQHPPAKQKAKETGDPCRISKPLELLRPSYDVVVIGSGYGGGVAASRLARGGQSVCVLERGKERWPGEYPKNMAEAFPEIHVKGSFAPWDTRGRYKDFDNPMGLYLITLGEGQHVVTGNGLGGTSLLNANIFLKADRKSLGLSEWPTEIREDPKILDKYYDRAASVLQPESYPTSYPNLAKLSLLQRQAAVLGLEDKFYRPPQTTRFVEGPNSTGVWMNASTGSGSDTTGVNDGSKSTTLVTYLSDAWNWGAEIFCECEVKHVKPAPKGEGYIVSFAWHGAKRGDFKRIFKQDLMWVHAKEFVFLGAGTLGTTEILLRSKQIGLPMSDTVGDRMSGNGDILAFGYNTDFEANAMEREGKHIDPTHPVGPTITGIIDCREQENPLDGFVLEEGAVPRALVESLQTFLELMSHKVYPDTSKYRRFVSRKLSRLFGPYHPGGSMQRTQTYLIMSHDSNQANLSLNSTGEPVLRWQGVGRSDHVKELNNFMARATNLVGGTFINNPMFAFFGQQEATVHPVGGAAMSADGTADEGATTSYGELLTGHGSEHHEGIVCVDGSVIPTALGVNPFATITALAERSVEQVATKKGIKIDYDTRNGALDLFGPPAKRLSLTPDLQLATDLIEEKKKSNATGTEFTEIMEGFIYAGSEILDFDVAAETARGTSSMARVFLSVHIWDEHDLEQRADHPGMLTGTFSCGALSKDPFLVLRGKFQLFSDDPQTPETQNLVYDFDMVNTDGEKFHFNGRKLVDSSIAFSPSRAWKATSTLYVTITRSRDGAVVGRGVLHVDPKDFRRQMGTLTTTGHSLISRLGEKVGYLGYFASRTARFFFSPFSALGWPAVSAAALLEKPPPAETTRIVASDGVESILHMWNAAESFAPNQLSSAVPVLFIPGASVDHRIFAMPTIKVNAIEYFTGLGATCFCVTHRVGKTEVALAGWTIYDARLDIEAALKNILKRYPAGTKVYVVAHCAGSIALSMGLLDGTIPADQILGITASNVFMQPKFALVNMIKARAPLSLATVYSKLAGQWFSCASSRDDSFVQTLLNQVLRFYPVGSPKEICNSVVCHRSELVFGRLWTHRNLNAETHAMLSEFLGGVSMPCLKHLLHMGTQSTVTTWPSKGSTGSTESVVDLLSQDNLDRLKHIPIYFFSGADNTVFTPESTDLSFTKLRENHEEQYERDVFDGFGHLDCWMGERAAEVVWPRVKEHMVKVSQHVVN